MGLYQTLQVLIGGQVKRSGRDPSQQPTNQNKRRTGGERGRGLSFFLDISTPYTYTLSLEDPTRRLMETMNTPLVMGGVRPQPIRILVKLPTTDLLPLLVGRSDHVSTFYLVLLHPSLTDLLWTNGLRAHAEDKHYHPPFEGTAVLTASKNRWPRVW